MFISSKYEEVSPPACSQIVSVSHELYSREEILRMEQLILSTLSFELTSPSAFVFFCSFATVAGMATAPRSTTELLANYLIELTLQEDRMRVYLPSLLCAAAIWLALKTRGELPWSAALAQHSTYTEADLQPCVRDLHGLHCEAASSRLQAVYMKYARWECRSVSCIKAVCAAQLDLAPQWWEKAARGRRQGERG